MIDCCRSGRWPGQAIRLAQVEQLGYKPSRVGWDVVQKQRTQSLSEVYKEKKYHHGAVGKT